MKNKRTSIAIVGKGRVGGSLAMLLEAGLEGYELQSWLPSRGLDFSALKKSGGPEVLIIATRDGDVAAVAKTVIGHVGPKLKLIVHLAGARPSTVLPKLPNVARLTLHPIQTFPEQSELNFAGISWMASSEDPEAISFARKFAKATGGTGIIELPGEVLPLYHSMIVIGANFATLLSAIVEELSKELKLNPQKMKDAMAPLMKMSLENGLKGPALAALTGPIKRQDETTLTAHRKALAKSAPKVRRVYQAFVAYATRRLKSERSLF